MQPTGIIDLIEKVLEIGDDLGKRLVGHGIDGFHLQRLHEALCLGVVVRIAAAAHGSNELFVR